MNTPTVTSGQADAPGAAPGRRPSPCSTGATPTARAVAGASWPRSAQHRRGRRDQRVGHRPGRRGRPQLPLPPPRPARKDPRAGRRAPATSERAGPMVTRASLQADLLAAHERAARLHGRIQHLERRLSDALGEHAWHDSGLGAPADIDALHQQITHLEQQVIDLGLQLDERDEDLAAARATNRELMTRLNTPHPTR